MEASTNKYGQTEFSWGTRAKTKIELNVVKKHRLWNKSMMSEKCVTLFQWKEFHGKSVHAT